MNPLNVYLLYRRPKWAQKGAHVAVHRIDEDWVIDRLDSFWPEHTAAFTRLLIALRQHFEDGLDAVIIIGAVSTGVRGDYWQGILLSD